jgi:hemerythrin-like domain-containing protein
MQAYLTRGIKDIIAEFPGIAKILQEYGIGCGPCTVGICQLQDILEIHKISKEAEAELMLRIEAEIYPERDLAVPLPAATLLNPSSEKIHLSGALRILVDEHKLIKRWLALMPVLAKTLDLSSEQDRQVIKDGIDFIRSYADRLHHGKEENILFNCFDDTEDIFRVIYEDHRRARSLVQQMLLALDEKNTKELCSNMLEYADLLEEHIRKEDEVLFPWLNGRLTKKQKEELATHFEHADKDIAMDIEKYRRFIERLEQAK